MKFNRLNLFACYELFAFFFEFCFRLLWFIYYNIVSKSKEPENNRPECYRNKKIIIFKVIDQNQNA